MAMKPKSPPKKPAKGLAGAATPGGEPIEVAIKRFAVALPLRDMFAAAALAGLLANSNSRGTPGEITKGCYVYADWMMEARK